MPTSIQSSVNIEEGSYVVQSFCNFSIIDYKRNKPKQGFHLCLLNDLIRFTYGLLNGETKWMNNCNIL